MSIHNRLISGTSFAEEREVCGKFHAFGQAETRFKFIRATSALYFKNSLRWDGVGRDGCLEPSPSEFVAENFAEFCA